MILASHNDAPEGRAWQPEGGDLALPLGIAELAPLVSLPPEGLAKHLAGLPNRQAWIDAAFDAAERHDRNNTAGLYDLAWRANDVAVLLARGESPSQIRGSLFRGIVADGETLAPVRPDRLAPGYIPPWGFVVNSAGELIPEPAGNDEPEAQIEASNDNEEAAHLWPAGDGSIAGLLSSPPPALAWFSRDRLLADRAHLLVGIGGSSKTRSLIQIAIGAVTGRLAWDWEISRTGGALLLLAEDTLGGFHRTLAAIQEHGQMTPAELRLLAERLRVFPMAGQDTKLLALQPGAVLTETSHFAGLVERCKRIPDLVFIGLDPALGLTEGDENNQTHQRRLGEMADRLAIATGACVVLVAHAAKALQTAEEVGSHSSRGGGAITDAVRGEFTLRTMTAQEARAFGIDDIEERKAHVQLVATKGNELPPGAFVPTWLKRGTGGILQQVSLEPSKSSGVRNREMQALEILRELTATGASKMKEWREACQAAGILTGDNERNHERSMERIRDSLRDAGLIFAGMGRGVWVPVEAEE